MWRVARTFEEAGDGRRDLAEEATSVQGTVRGNGQGVGRVEAGSTLYEHGNLAVAIRYVSYSL